MRYSLLLVGILFVAPQSAPANTAAYARCGTYDSYILLYKSIQKFEELGKLHCGEGLQITGQDGDYSQVKTGDGRLGWVPSSDLSTTAPPPQSAFTFGWTEKAMPEPKSDPAADPQLEAAPAEPTAQPAETPVAVARPSESVPLLTNVNVMKMQGARQTPDAIITKIDASRCDFDTSAAALHRLKLSGVSDRIILAMMHAPAAFPAVPDAAQSVEVRIPNQTAVQVAVSGDVAADNLQEGSVVEMVVLEPVTLDGVTVIPRGAQARARVMAVRRSSLGSSGQVVWFMQDITATTGDRVPASFAAAQDSGAKLAIGKFSGYPFFLTDFHKGAPAIAASSSHYTVLVDGSIPLRVARPISGEQAVARPAAQPQAVPQVAPAVTTAPVFPVVVQTPDEHAAIKP
jgi:hypothetical protein